MWVYEGKHKKEVENDSLDRDEEFTFERNTLRTGLLIFLNARPRGLIQSEVRFLYTSISRTIQRQAPCIS